MRRPVACVVAVVLALAFNAHSANAATGCASTSAQASSTACHAQLSDFGTACFWDLWLAHCYTSESEVSALYPCSRWSTEPSSPEAACGAHGCTWFNQQCYGQSGGVMVNTTATAVIFSDVSAAWVDPVFVPNTDMFGFHTLVPFTVPVNPNYWWIMTVGDETIGTDANPIAVGQCSSLGAIGQMPAPYSFGDTAGLVADAAAWIRSVLALPNR